MITVFYLLYSKNKVPIKVMGAIVNKIFKTFKKHGN